MEVSVKSFINYLFCMNKDKHKTEIISVKHKFTFESFEPVQEFFWTKIYYGTIFLLNKKLLK